MNTYFYPAKPLNCGNTCNYPTCSRKCLSLLTDQQELNGLRVLPGGSQFKSPRSMELRSGDIVILYAETETDLEALVAIQDFLETFRIILIVADSTLLRNGRYHSLKPRFTTQIGENIDKLGSIISRILSGHDCQSAVAVNGGEKHYA